MNTEELNKEEAQLLQELNSQLPELELPPDFAQSVAQQARVRYRQLPLWSKLQLWGQMPVGSARSRLWTLAFGTACLMGGLLAPGSLFLLLLLPLLVRLTSAPSTTLAFWTLPALCTLVTGSLFGLFCWLLNQASFSFRGQDSLGVVGPVTAVALMALLGMGLAPSWRALRERSLGHAGWALLAQGVAALWLAALICPLLPSPWGQGLFAGLLLWMLGSAWVLRRAEASPPRTSLPAALLRSAGSLLLGGTPIVSLILGFFWVHLTHEISDPKTYQRLLTETGTWVKQEQSIPADQNGWIQVKAWMLKTDDPEMLAIGTRLRAGTALYEHQRKTEELSREVEAQKRRDFLLELPRIEQALKKPKFSWVATQGLSFESLVPNYLLCRSVSQGLTALAQEALQQKRGPEALERLLLNLRWSSSIGEQTLISLMIEIAQLNIALEPVSDLLLYGQLGPVELERLQRGLEAAQPRLDSLLQVMDREMVAADELMRRIRLENTGSRALGIDFWWRLLPRVYWQSEQNAYLNLHLSQRDGWKQLGQPAAVQLPAFSIIANLLTPNSAKAQTQFLAVQTRFEASKTQVALERYRLEQGRYPDRLEQLVPRYLERQPLNYIHPNLLGKKPPLAYEQTGNAYQLKADSPLYLTIDKPRVQIWPPSTTTQR